MTTMLRLRTPFLRSTARPFTTQAVLRKGPVDMAKEALKTVDRTVSDAAVKGIEKGEEVTRITKETIAKVKGRTPSAENVKGKASEMSGEAKGKAKEVGGEAKSKAKEFEEDIEDQFKF